MLLLAGLVAPALSLAACGGSSNSSGGSSKNLVGAGSTLVAPLVSVWQPEYLKESGVSVAYSAIGSGGGIAQITARTVNFGASDAPLTEDQFKEATKEGSGVVQIPWALGSVVAVYHVEGVLTHLRLTGPVLAEIYEGKIAAWNNPKIAALNPGVTLPSTKITPIYRSDGSGDTYAFTDYLSRISPEWKASVGNATQVKFPAGVGAKGSSGISAAVTSTNGSIGYLTLAYVLQGHLDDALIKNAAGNYPVPGIPTIEAAAKTLKEVPSNNAIHIVDPPASAPEAYPISTFTYSLVPLKSPHASTLKAFLKWAITTGQKFGPKLDFVPIPEQIRAADEATIDKVEG
jgi:phosphate transport system substrate-binding protein